MISVQNRLQLLSGSRFFLSLFIVLICSTQAIAQNNEESDDEQTTEEHSYYSEVDTTIYSNGSETVAVYTYKPQYNIAYILPISTDKIVLGDGKTIPTKMPMSTREVLGFWEGANLAMDSIKGMRSKFNLHIWDNHYSDSLTEVILNSLDSFNIDVIVSPFHTKQAIMVSQYCRNRNIPFFLAQNPSDAPVKANSNAYKFHISKSRSFYNYYKLITEDVSQDNNKLIMVYDDKNKSDRRLKNYMKYMDENKQLNRLFFVGSSELDLLPKMMDSLHANNLIVTLYKTEQVNELLDTLDNHSDRFIVNLYGHKYWTSNKKIKYKTLEKYNTHIYTDFYLKNNPSLINKLKAKYDKMTKDNVVIDVFKGYDATLYITNVLNTYGMDFPKYMSNYKYLGVCSNIHMVPRYNNDGAVMFYENNAKFLLNATPDGWVVEAY